MSMRDQCRMAFSLIFALLFCAAPSLPAGPLTEVDLGLFARVVTSDPQRFDGARTGRLEEFRTQDVFLSQELRPRDDGTFALPANSATGSAIGLEWAERRVLRQLILEFVAPPLPPAGIQLQFWSSAGQEDSWSGIGQTPWQGRWERLPAKIERQENRLLATIANDAVPEFKNGTGVLKVRWLLPASGQSIRIKRPRAFGPAVWQTADLRIETSADPRGEGKAAVYNGLLIDSTSGRSLLEQTWNTRQPFRLRVVYSRPSPSKADRTLLRFQLPAGPVTVAVEDVLANEGVYARDFGLLVCRAEATEELAAYRRKMAGRETILARVRKMPDQRFPQAMGALWRPIQNNGPTMLSLACDNEKFILDRDGALRYGRLSLRPLFPAGKVEVARLDFGEVGIDTAVRPIQAAKALPLQIGKKTYKKGLGVHANAEVVVGLDERYQAFEAEVGVHPWTPPGGTVVFQVDVDGQRRFDSGVLRQGEAPRPVRVPLAGAKRLVLRVNDAGDGILNDAAHLAEARLLPVGPPSLQPIFLSDLYARQVRAQADKTRNLEGRWLPIVVNTSQAGGAVLRQRTWVAPLTPIDRPWDAIGKTQSLGVVVFTLENLGTKPADISLRLGTLLTSGQSPGKPGVMKTLGHRILWTEGDRLLAVFDVSEVAPLALSVSPGGLHFTGSLPAGAVRPLTAYIPAWPASPSEQAQIPSPTQLKEQTIRYWEELFRKAMHIELPEPLLEDVFRATQVHCLIAARNEAAGRLVAPWCAADSYGPLDTEAQPVILGMSLAGHAEFARRGLDFFIASYNPDGLLVKGYTLMGTGQHLWTLGEHYALHPDRRWLESMAPKIIKSCRWIVRQADKTKRRNPQDEPLPEYGLVPPGVLADWNRYAYYFYANGHFGAGLGKTAQLLAEHSPTEAKQLQQAANEYRANILRAFRWQRGQMPVVPLRDGTWVSPCPSSLYCYGLTREFFGGVSAIGHDVEAGGHHLIPLGLLGPKSPEAAGIIDYLEDRWFLIDGIFNAYPARENEADWFNRGGFAKLQPHYARTTDLHALRDDVKPFVRTYFNTFPVLLNKENLSFWEHMNNGGAWNKTHESAWFVQMTRTMLVSERGDELWLAPMVTNQWLKPGRKVAVRQAPTRFGPVSYEIKSAVNKGQIEAVIQPPQRQPPRQIVIRLRHPEGKPIRSVTVDGRPHTQFDPQREVVQLRPQGSSILVIAKYD